MSFEAEVFGATTAAYVAELECVDQAAVHQAAAEAERTALAALAAQRLARARLRARAERAARTRP